MTIKATISRILYPQSHVAKDGSPQWWILQTSAGKVVGSSRIIFQNYHAYTFEGDFSSYQGQLNFKFTSAREDIPTDPKAVLGYACKVTYGIGEAFAEQIWQKYGADYEQALLGKTNRTAREEKLLMTLSSLKEDATRTAIISNLVSHGATLNFAEQAYAFFGNQLGSLLRDNLYVLTELPGQSFKTIDERFREAYNIALDNPCRVVSLVLYTLNALAEETGDTLIPYGELAQKVAEYNIEEQQLEDIMFTTPELALYVDKEKNTFATTAKNFKFEKELYNFSNEWSTLKKPCTLLPQEDVTLDESQLDALRDAISPYSRKVCVINGGAGCGKTTIIKSIAKTFDHFGIPFKLCAFAGKAAARIREATGYPASTIHSMLKYAPEKGFTLDTLAGSVVIIDEASMVPSALLHAITERRPEKLILVGDEGQLPPVGAGAPFHDFVRNGFAKTVTTCYRNTEAIFQAAYAVRNGSAPISASTAHEAFTLCGVRNTQAAQDYIESAIIPLLDFDQDIIIAPRNGSEEALPASVNQLNAAVMRHLGREGKLEIESRIIFTKNDPSKNVWNGTTGTVQAVDIDGNAYVALDDGGEAKLSPDYCDKNTAPAYALTIHKSQGSQYRRVVIVALRRDIHTLLDRKMLYTAITRAKEGCLIVTDTNLLSVVSKNEPRHTILSHLLLKDANEAE